MTKPIPTMRRRVLILAAGITAFGGLPQAHAQGSAASFPNRPIKLLVGYSAGGGVDAMARMLSPRLSNLLGQQVVVENRAGAAGLIAGDAAAKSAPDGYTLLLGESGLLIAQYLQPRMSFDPVKSFTPVAGVFTLPLVIVASNEVPAKTPRDFVALMKSQPGKFSYATSGVGTVQHLGFEMLKGQAGAHVVHIPYRGAAQIVPDVISGQVPLGVVSVTAAIAQAKAGKLQAVAMMSNDKLPGAENIPPLSDALPGFSVAPRLYLLAPAGTPAPVVERLSDAVRTVMAAPDMAQAAAQLGAVPAYVAPAELGPAIAQESATWGKVVKDQKISAE